MDTYISEETIIVCHKVLSEKENTHRETLVETRLKLGILQGSLSPRCVGTLRHCVADSDVRYMIPYVM